ncbi:MAG: C40 family peptidase [Oscillospiraceae bacterium]|nr:C40 family peptidase [Oscillospiraceae bacterium]
MINAQDLCSVFNKTLKDGWGVVPGFDGQVLTQDMIDSRLTDPQMKQSASKWIGKHVADAGGLFAYAFRTMGMVDGYTADGKYIEKIFKEFCETTGKLPKGGLVPGMVIFKKRNDVYSGVGIYIGNSSIIEARSSKVGVIVSRLTSEWTYWGKLKNVEYAELPSKASLRKKEVRDMRVLRGPVLIEGVPEQYTIRADKALGAKAIDTLSLGTKATVVEDCGEFCKIQYMKTGYIKKEFLKEVVSK